MDQRIEHIVNRLSQDSANRDLQTAIRACYRELGIDPKDIGCADYRAVSSTRQTIASYIYRNYKNTLDQTIILQRVVPQRLSLSMQDFEDGVSKMDTKDVVLTALALVGAGYAIHCMLKSKAPSANKPSVPPLPQIQPQREKWVLILVINAGRTDILAELKKRGAVDSSQGDALYRVTQALWFARESDFQKSTMKDWFAPSRRVKDQSEYDVYLLKFSMPEDDPGFRRNASQPDRIDAFTRLAMRSTRVELSERVPSDAYDSKEVYSR